MRVIWRFLFAVNIEICLNGGSDGGRRESAKVSSAASSRADSRLGYRIRIPDTVLITRDVLKKERPTSRIAIRN